MGADAEPLLVYLHGFLSSPDSKKARQTRSYAESLGLGDNLLIPFLKEGPAATIARVKRLLKERAPSRLAFIGSSLGGYYATVLAEYFSSPAVLINPAVRPGKYWRRYLGRHKNYHGREVHEVTAEHVRELEVLAPATLHQPENYLLFLQRGDEVLDYRQAVDLYGARQCIIRDTGSHSYEDFAVELPAVFEFLLSRIDHKVR